jgi:hypothetical protein
VSTDDWRERALAAEGELARLRAQLAREDHGFQIRAREDYIETATDRARREYERRANAPTEVALRIIPERACAANCPCSSCDRSRPDPDPDLWMLTEHQPLVLDPIHE